MAGEAEPGLVNPRAVFDCMVFLQGAGRPASPARACFHLVVGYMSARDTTRRLSEQETDRIVLTEVNDDSAWERPVRVRRTKPASLTIPADLAARAAFLAQLHRRRSVAEWLTHIIQERVELEEAAYNGAKQDLAGKVD